MSEITTEDMEDAEDVLKEYYKNSITPKAQFEIVEDYHDGAIASEIIDIGTQNDLLGKLLKEEKLSTELQRCHINIKMSLNKIETHQEILFGLDIGQFKWTLVPKNIDKSKPDQ